MKLGELQKLTQVFAENKLAENTNVNDHKKMYEQLQMLGFDPTNVYQELEMTSPLVDTHRDVSYSNAHIQLHSHAFYELLYCRNTCGTEYLIGSERYRLQRGDLIFVPPGFSHRPLLPENITAPYKRYVLWMSQEFMKQYASLLTDFSDSVPSQPRMLRTAGTHWNESLGNLFRQGVQESEQQADGWEAAVIGNTITLLTQIKRATTDRNAHALVAEKPELLDQIMLFVEQNYTNDILISEIAKTFYVSSSTISHLFKQKLGISFYRFVTQRRLIAAKILIEKNIPLETVASKVGFKDYSGFYRAFKQEYGISPRQYRSL